MRKLVALALILLAAATAGAFADNYPSRVITIVAPYPAGGPTDTIARILAERMQAALGQSVIVENISGAGGSIGVGRVAHAPPDGYTVSIGHVQTAVFNPAIMKLDYDVVNDLAPVSLIADTPIWIVANKALPADDVKGLIAWLKAGGGKATMGTVGVGGPTDVAARIFEKETGTAFQIIPYRGGAPLVEDMLGGHIDFAFGQAATYLTYVRDGQLKAYAVLQPKRWWAAPEVPTLDELGIKNIDASFWHGIWVPKGTPPDIIAKLNGAIREALADPGVQERFKKIGQEIWPPDYQTPEALAAKQQAEIAKWTPIIKESGIKVD
ncbi:MAG TPA: tripartite tricarboxylate transporter substrate binding protein [Xanthobacteraceae bacterium]|jgi:tripartite-type tricarboxylate transporter receptor subunit TctC|nr:tripartite tricarboxylate transporter substrate binding protein [Xanthobacteraceae bacterium]